MSGPFSSVVNFSVHQFLHRAEKLCVLQTIKSEAVLDSNYPLIFPRHRKEAQVTTNSISTLSAVDSFSNDDIEQMVYLAFADACELLKPLGMDILRNNRKIITIDAVSFSVKSRLEKSRTTEYSSQRTESSDSDSESDYDTIDVANDNEQEASDSEDEYESEEGIGSKYLSNVSNCTFNGMRVYDTVKPSLAHSYFKVLINDREKFLHKQTACWLLTHQKSTLSSDRLVRVKTEK